MAILIMHDILMFLVLHQVMMGQQAEACSSYLAACEAAAAAGDQPATARAWLALAMARQGSLLVPPRAEVAQAVARGLAVAPTDPEPLFMQHQLTAWSEDNFAETKVDARLAATFGSAAAFAAERGGDGWIHFETVRRMSLVDPSNWHVRSVDFRTTVLSWITAELRHVSCHTHQVPALLRVRRHGPRRGACRRPRRRLPS